MTPSTETPHIFAALAAVMADCTEVAKRDVNTDQRYYFRGVDAVVNAVGPLLRKHGVLSIPRLVHVDYAERTSKQGSLGTVCRMVVDYTFYASKDGSTLPEPVRVASEAMDWSDKATAKAMSVAERTALIQALALPTDAADPDAETPQAVVEKPTTTRRMTRSPAVAGGGGITEAQVKKIAVCMGELGLKERADALKYVADVIGHPIDSRNDLTLDEAKQVIDSLEADLTPPDPHDGNDPWAGES